MTAARIHVAVPSHTSKAWSHALNVIQLVNNEAMDDEIDDDMCDWCFDEEWCHDCGDDTCCCTAPHIQDLVPCPECNPAGQ